MIDQLPDHVQEQLGTSGRMIDKLHDHIQEELKTNARTDTVFIITAILLNLLTLGINAALAASEDASGTITAVLVTFIVLVLVINVVAIVGLSKGKQTRAKLLRGLELMYADEGVAKYYDHSILANYDTRYVLFILAVLCTGATAIVVPAILLVGT